MIDIDTIDDEDEDEIRSIKPTEKEPYCEDDECEIRYKKPINNPISDTDSWW
jgi:hypothetical protein